jgi:hypothetical protein
MKSGTFHQFLINRPGHDQIAFYFSSILNSYTMSRAGEKLSHYSRNISRYSDGLDGKGFFIRG